MFETYSGGLFLGYAMMAISQESYLVSAMFVAVSAMCVAVGYLEIHHPMGSGKGGEE